MKACNTKIACVQYAIYWAIHDGYNPIGEIFRGISDLGYLVWLLAELIGRARVSYRGWK